MALPMAAWRVSYASGGWLALSGPTSLVIMMPPPPAYSHLVAEYWENLISMRTPDSLFRYLAEVGIDEMPNFGAFFWDTRGLHGICRGTVQVFDAEGELVLDAEGKFLWDEALLDTETTYTVVTGEEPGDDAVLPLVVGAARVSTLLLTTAKDQLLRFAGPEQQGVLPRIPMLGLRPRHRTAKKAVAREAQQPVPARGFAGDDEVAEAPVVAKHQAPVDDPVAEDSAVAVVEDNVQEDTVPGEAALLETSLMPIFDEEAEVEEDKQTDSGGQEETEEPAAQEAAAPEPPAAPESPAAVEPPTTGGPEPTQVADQQASPRPKAPQPGQSMSRPVVVPGVFGEVEESDHTVLETGLAAVLKPKEQQSEPVPQLMAAPCRNNHANPVGARTCRICRTPVDSSKAAPIRRPVLSGVCANSGEFINVEWAVVIGRSPNPSSVSPTAKGLTVPSPQKDISRSHLLIEQRDWNVVARDLNSTNGTTVRSVGEPPFELRDGREVQLEIGTILDLGEGVSLRLEPPRNV